MRKILIAFAILAGVISTGFIGMGAVALLCARSQWFDSPESAICSFANAPFQALYERTEGRPDPLRPDIAVIILYEFLKEQKLVSAEAGSSLYCGDNDFQEDSNNYYFVCSVLQENGHRVTIGRYSVDKYTGDVGHKQP
ncbi:MAG TPA: hypothetical protein VJH69_03920 [Candidatus Paceibacterota bacterium]|uniref:Uncharacterized protein n=1 Tax=Candidatus Ryanbacteria bacterium RIFCSPHIGHO2_01_FULL_45_22 TaxID=1802114 RepID=A0A1G2G266_9BACT|nr:MAG: hypothetical protein A2719_04435 [Candidatus Ryanbacteria bacterium RIFCSPHIGHO2_01_FULL_45_22]